MSKSKVAPSEQLSMVIDPHRHLSHFGAEGRACPEGPRGRSPRSAPVAPGSAAAHNACLDQMPGGPLGEPTQQLRSVHILPYTRQQLLDLQGRGHPFAFGAQIVEKQQLDVCIGDRQPTAIGHGSGVARGRRDRRWADVPAPRQGRQAPRAAQHRVHPGHRPATCHRSSVRSQACQPGGRPDTAAMPGASLPHGARWPSSATVRRDPGGSPGPPCSRAGSSPYPF